MVQHLKSISCVEMHHFFYPGQVLLYLFIYLFSSYFCSVYNPEAFSWAMFPETSFSACNLLDLTENFIFWQVNVFLVILIVAPATRTTCFSTVIWCFIYRWHWYNWKTSGTSKSPLRERITSGVWEDCSYSCSRKGLVSSYCCHAKDWSAGVWRYVRIYTYFS